MIALATDPNPQSVRASQVEHQQRYVASMNLREHIKVVSFVGIKVIFGNIQC